MTDSHAADVQAELQQYLNSKNINALFISIVESLLIEKPSNPIAYIIEYLHKQFPDQAKPALEALGGGGGTTAPVIAAPKIESREAKAASKAAKEADSDEDDGDDVADIPAPVANPAAKKGGRRTSVSAESTDPTKMKDAMSKIAKIPKSSEVTA